MTVEDINDKTVEDLYQIMSTSLKLQQRTLSCLQNIEVLLKENNTSNKQEEALINYKKELFKLLLADPQLTESMDDQQEAINSMFGPIMTTIAEDDETSTNETQVAETAVVRNDNDSTKKISPRQERLRKLLGYPTVTEGPRERRAAKGIATRGGAKPGSAMSVVSRSTIARSVGHPKKTLSPPTQPGKLLHVRCTDDHLRDIGSVSTVGADGKPNSDRKKLSIAIAHILSEKNNTKRPLQPDSKATVDTYTTTKLLVDDIHSHLIHHVSTTTGQSIENSMKRTRWDNVPDELKDKYCFFIEQHVRERVGINIGRCKNMWMARMLLRRALFNRSYKTAFSTQSKLVKEHLASCDGKRCLVKEKDISRMTGLPLSLLNGVSENDEEATDSDQNSDSESSQGGYAYCSKASQRQGGGNRSIKMIPAVIPAEDDESESDSDDVGSMEKLQLRKQYSTTSDSSDSNSSGCDSDCSGCSGCNSSSSSSASSSSSSEDSASKQHHDKKQKRPASITDLLQEAHKMNKKSKSRHSDATDRTHQ